jgi:hypothetical protein
MQDVISHQLLPWQPSLPQTPTSMPDTRESTRVIPRACNDSMVDLVSIVSGERRVCRVTIYILFLYRWVCDAEIDRNFLRCERCERWLLPKARPTTCRLIASVRCKRLALRRSWASTAPRVRSPRHISRTTLWGLALHGAG